MCICSSKNGVNRQVTTLHLRTYMISSLLGILFSWHVDILTNGICLDAVSRSLVSTRVYVHTYVHTYTRTQLLTEEWPTYLCARYMVCGWKKGRIVGTYVCFVLILWRNAHRFDNNTILLKFVEKNTFKSRCMCTCILAEGRIKGKILHKPCNTGQWYSTGHQTGFIIRIIWVRIRQEISKHISIT